MVVLGSSNPIILSDRIQQAISYSKGLPEKTKIIWFLTGGIKYTTSETSDESEAHQMENQLNLDKYSYVVLDKNSTNTSENFANLVTWLYKTFSNKPFPKIVITTSEFHKARAAMILKEILEKQKKGLSLETEWNLGKVDCPYCWSDEQIHMKNRHMDVMRAAILFDM
jgi:uncharacterized SAM-binding protein YcdF (DUF218 family)